MKKRIAYSGSSPREEMIRDSQNVLKEELEHDISYSTSSYIYDSYSKTDVRLAKIRLFEKSYSSINGNYIKFTTTYDNPIKVGEYIHDKQDDTYWLVYNSFNINNTHYEGKLVQCNYLLKWQISNGKIVERWANIVSASKYDVGETGNSSVIVASNNFTVMIGYCDEGLELEDKRVFIDKKTIPNKVFKMTRADDILYDFLGIGAMLGFIADRNTYNPDKDNNIIGICDYIDPNILQEDIDGDVLDNKTVNKMPVLNAVINGVDNIKIGVKRAYIAKVQDCMGNEVSWNKEIYSWKLTSDNEEFNLKIKQEVINNKIILNMEDESFIGSSFLLQLLNGEEIIADKKINIIALA